MLHYKHNKQKPFHFGDPMDNNENKTTFDLELQLYKLLEDEPFFASLSRRINKTKSTAVATAGVRVNKDTGRYEMVYNPQFFERLTFKERRGVLKHEFYHLIFEHVTSGRMPDGELTKMWNIACDLAINCFIMDELPKGACIPQQEPFQNYPLNQSAEFYYNMLKEDEQFNQDQQDGDGDGDGQGDGQGGGKPNGQGKGKGSGLPDTLDEHGEWGDKAEQGIREIAEQRLKEDLKQAMDEINSSGRGWGTVGQEIRKQIQDFITPTVDWRKVLRYFIKTSQRADKRSTVKKINKRFPYIHAGKKVTRQAKIAIAIDQSGSVGDDLLALFFSELSSLSKYAEFTIIPFDTDVAEDKVWVWKKGKKHTWERVLTGGTNFDAPTKYVNDRDFDALLVLTDMEAPKPKACKAQRAWVTAKQYADRPYFNTSERIIVVDK